LSGDHLFLICLYLKNNSVGRILAIDYGRKRTGIAVTDTLKLIANGLDTIATHDLVDFLKKYFLSENVERVVIGYPKQMNNQPSEIVVYIDEFLKRFKKLFPDKPIDLVDERFTSKLAFQAMIDGGVKKQKRRDKALIDKISATIILQSYLETKKNNF
jgi:putative holliday junction resolvase